MLKSDIIHKLFKHTTSDQGNQKIEQKWNNKYISFVFGREVLHESKSYAIIAVFFSKTNDIITIKAARNAW